MPQSDHTDKAPAVENGGDMFHMNPHSHRCCQHNAGHAWPYFTEHLWYAAPGNGLAAYLYAPCEVKAKVGDGVEVTITEKTKYPFEEEIELIVALPKSTAFPLYLRIPEWGQKASITIAGEKHAGLTPGKLFKAQRTWKNGDVVHLKFPMDVSVTSWKNNRGTVSVNRGPLTYSLLIKEEYRRFGGTDAWPAFDIFPASPWNYGLVNTSPKAFTVEKAPWPKDDQPFVADKAPIRIVTTAKRIPNWTLDAKGAVNEVGPQPVRSTERDEKITLVPMGGARLRISAFPVISNGPEAHDWPVPPKPAFKGSASHTWDLDSTDALSDGLTPARSNDGGIPRFTWWPRRGSREWVQYDFDQARDVSGVEVYWFDDAPNGGCRAPAAWKVLYREGENWKPVEGATAFETKLNGFNKVSFNTVKTSALRIDAELASNFSSGILEWKVD